MKTPQLIAVNNERRRLLNPDNLQAYEDALVYIRLHAGRSEYETESVLLELLEHLIEAQANGKDAADVFGEDLAEYCDGLIAQIPQQSLKSRAVNVMYYASLMLGYYFVILTIVQLLSLAVPALNMTSISIIPIIALIVLGGTEIVILLNIMKSAVFQPRFRMILAALSGGVMFGAFILVNVWFRHTWTVPLNLWSCLAATALLLVLSRLFKRMSASD